MKDFHNESMEKSISSKKEIMNKMDELIENKSSKRSKKKSYKNDGLIKLEHYGVE